MEGGEKVTQTGLSPLRSQMRTETSTALDRDTLYNNQVVLPGENDVVGYAET